MVVYKECQKEKDNQYENFIQRLYSKKTFLGLTCTLIELRRTSSQCNEFTNGTYLT